MRKLKVCWLSAGVSSFIAGYLERDSIDEYIYIDIEDQHPDSMRFIKDCERVLGKPVTILKSQYGSVENAIKAFGNVRMVKTGFAPCTAWLKKAVRKQWEYEHRDFEITYVWGFDADEKHRAEVLEETMFEFNHKRAGYPITREMETERNRYGEPIRYARYRLEAAE